MNGIKNSRAREIARLLLYISQKFLSVDIWFGLCENSHNANGKKTRKYENIVKNFKKSGPNGEKMSMLGVEAQEKLKKEEKQ